MVRRSLVNLFDAVDRQRDQLETLKEQEGLEGLEESLQECRDEMDEFDSFEDVPDALVDIHDDLVEEYDVRAEEYNSRVDILEAAEARLEEYDEADVLEDPGTDEESGWSSTQVRLKELTMGDLGRIRDKTGASIQDAQDAFEAGQGAAMIESLRLTVDRLPDGAPDDAADLPVPIGQLILLESHQLAGMDPAERELGKSSARQYMTR